MARMAGEEGPTSPDTAMTTQRLDARSSRRSTCIAIDETDAIDESASLPSTPVLDRLICCAAGFQSDLILKCGHKRSLVLKTDGNAL